MLNIYTFIIQYYLYSIWLQPTLKAILPDIKIFIELLIMIFVFFILRLTYIAKKIEPFTFQKI